jgi:endo-1,4-beta-xylanase
MKKVFPSLSLPLARRNLYKIGVVVFLGAAITGVVVMMQKEPANNKVLNAKTAVSPNIDLLRGQWAYLAGASVQKDGLHITYTGLQIVQQDGSGGQSNPPVNMYGTHLSFSGAFTLTAVAKNVHGTAVLRLYGKPPVIQDEFRVEPPSVQFAIKSGAVTVSTWDGKATHNLTSQKSVTQQMFKFKPAASTQLSLAHKNGTMTVAVNGKKVGTVSERSAFKSGQIWFGADAPGASDRWTLSQLGVLPGSGGKVQAVDTTQVTSALRTSADGLQTMAAKKRPGFLIGSAMALSPALSDAKYSNIAFGGNFGAMTVENALKFQFVHPQPNLYTFQEADALVNLARSHDLTVHGHALVFGEANPSWISSLPTATSAEGDHVKEVMTDHIAKVVGHFKGRVASWDVVNEPLADYDDTPDGEGATLRQHIWERALGQSYIPLAFRAAHQADPDAKLYLNDYGLESDGDRWDAFVSLVSQLKRDGVPIYGVGFESHVYEAEDQIDTRVLRQHIRQLASLGLKSRISEMDVYTDDGPTVQATQYANVLSMCLSEPSCASFTTWGFDDDYDMWQEDDHSLQAGKDLLWTTGATPTLALEKLKEVLKE